MQFIRRQSSPAACIIAGPSNVPPTLAGHRHHRDRQQNPRQLWNTMPAYSVAISRHIVPVLQLRTGLLALVVQGILFTCKMLGASVPHGFCSAISISDIQELVHLRWLFIQESPWSLVPTVGRCTLRTFLPRNPSAIVSLPVKATAERTIEATLRSTAQRTDAITIVVARLANIRRRCCAFTCALVHELV